MTTTPHKKGDWNAWIVIIMIISISFLATLLFKSSVSGGLNDTGKHGLYLFKRYLAEKNIRVETYDPAETDVASGLVIHLLPYESSSFSPLQAGKIEERLEYLNELKEKSPRHLVYLVNFKFRDPEEVYKRAIYSTHEGATEINGYILQNKVIPFETPLVDTLISTIEDDIDGLQSDLVDSETNLRFVYHSDVLRLEVENSHWIQLLPIWMQWGLLQLMIILGVYFMAVGRHFNFPLEDGQEAEPTPLTYISASAAYYRRHHLTYQILEWYYHALARVIPKDQFLRDETFKDMPSLYRQWQQIEHLRDKKWKNHHGQPLRGKAFIQQVKQIDILTGTLKEKRKRKWQQFKAQ